MGYAHVCIETAGDHLFWEQGVLGAGRGQGSGVRDRESRLGLRVSPHPDSRYHTHWGVLEEFVFSEVFPEDEAAVSANGPGSLHLHHRLMVLQAPL